MPKPKHTEFLSIVKGLRPEEIPNKSELMQIETYSDNTKQIESSNQQKNLRGSTLKYTLDQYCKKLESELDTLTDSQQEEAKAIINKRNQAATESVQSSEIYVAPSESFKANAVVFKPSKKSPLKMTDPDNLPHRIRIPKEEWKEGSLYKVNDCFYNDRGYFLYRVPGLMS